jgi:hypothetical protein
MTRDAEKTSFPWMTGQVGTPAGEVPVVSTKLTWADHAGSWRVRCGIGRGNYAVPPGLYALGSPGAGSPVLVTANYKLTFDRVRRAVDGQNAWLLVLDTKGINVWCAAGKGTLGTDEVVAKVVSHRTIILPQLSASGVAAHMVKRRCGFQAVFGPVRVEDLPAFLAAGSEATPEMRRVTFPLKDRLILTPLEGLTVVRHPAFLAVLGLWVLNLSGLKFFYLDGPAIIGTAFVGTVAVPALLPWIPGRAFAWKGWLVGLAWAVIVCRFRGVPAALAGGWPAALSYVFLLPAFSAFLAMNFTGSSTFTSLSGVVREMKYALPLIIVSAALGIAAMAAGLFLK